MERLTREEKAKRLAGEEKALKPVGANQHGEGLTNSDNVRPSQSDYGNAATYRVRKLKRDHPQVAERLAAGEFKSVAAAERAANGQAHQAGSTGQRIVDAAKATTGEVVLSRGNPTGANQHARKEEIANLAISQPDRASSAGISPATQKKLDALARKAPAQLERIRQGEVSGSPLHPRPASGILPPARPRRSPVP